MSDYLSASTRYRAEQKLGEGTYGEVYKGTDTLEKRTVAIKKIRAGTEDQGIASTELREISILNHLEHRNVVRLLDVVSYSTRILLIFEYCDGDLRQLIKKSPLKGKKLKSMMYQLLKGLEFCHDNRIIHRDLKPQNLLVADNNETLKIADFGLARAFQMPLPSYTHEVVTLWYRAPEILLGDKRYNPVVDTWSCGCILSEMATGHPLFPGDCEIDELFQIFRTFGTPDEQSWPGVTSLADYQPVFPRWRPSTLSCPIDSAGMDLLRKLLVLDPKRRMSAHQGATHPWFNDIIATNMP